MPKPTEAELSAENEELLRLCEQLQERIESLMQTNAALREQLAAGESQAERLTALVAQERWVRLSEKLVLRVSDIRQIEENGRSMVSQDLVGLKWYGSYWPHPMLIVNGSVELKFPLWKMEELLQEVGAQEVPLPRDRQEIKLEPDMDKPLPPPEQKPLTSPT